MVLQPRKIGIVHLLVQGGAQIAGHFPFGVEGAHAEVELHAREVTVDSELGQRFRLWRFEIVLVTMK
jgi:hypothetical protein